MKRNEAQRPATEGRAASRFGTPWRSITLVVAAAVMAGCGGSGGDDDTSGGPGTPVDQFPLIATPTVTGPIASESFFSPTNNYTFYATDVGLGSHGYVEEEFFVQGTANAYDAPTNTPATPPTANASVVTANVPYKTRFVVRRPTDAAKFNGTVVIEWLNVTDNFDGEYFWVQAKDHLLREGYAYIGVSAQNNGIANPNLGLKWFSPTRYASLDVTGGGTIAGDQLSYDIYSQTAKAARAVPEVLGGLAVKNVMAIGMSQSGSRMGVYTNYVHMRAPIYDSFLIQVSQPAIRDDMTTPLIKVLSESEAGSGRLALTQADTPSRKTYWVAGTAHGDVVQRMGRTGVRLRDLGPQNTGNDNCLSGTVATRTRTPYGHVLSAAVHHLKQQVETGVQPPSAPMIASTGGATPQVQRDVNGNAIGGIRLAHMEVPTARADGIECGNIGAWVPFTTTQLDALYPSHSDYLAKVTSAVNASMTAGFVLPRDGEKTIAEAQASVIGRGLECGLLCLSAGHFRADFSSTGLLRDNTVYYSIKDGAQITKAIDEAHFYVASMYASTGAARQYNLNFAVVALQAYIAHVRTSQSVGNVTTTAADLLVSQANTIVDALKAL